MQLLFSIKQADGRGPILDLNKKKEVATMIEEKEKKFSKTMV